MKKLIRNIDIISYIVGVFIIILFNPKGLLSTDSVVQFYQAITNCYSDWHPPMMGFLWKNLEKLFGFIDVLYYFHLLIFFIGVFNIIYYLRKKSIFLSISFIFFILLIIFRERFLFYIWKDVGLFVIYIFIIGISLSIKIIKNHYIKYIIIIISIILLFYSISIRSNSIFSGYIMILLLFYSLNKKLITGVILTTIIWMIMLIGNNYFNYKYLNSKKLYPVKYIMISDIYQINYRKNKNLPEFLRGNGYSEEKEKEIFENKPNINKYVLGKNSLINVMGNSVLSKGIKNYDIKNLEEKDLDYYSYKYKELNDKEILKNYNKIKSYWLSLIRENSFLFLKIKIKFFINLVGGFEFIGLMIINLILQYFYSFKKRRIKQLLIYLSSCFYLWPYLIFNPSYDYRYVAYCILVEIFMFIYVFYTNFEDISDKILFLKKKEREIMKER